VVLIRHLLAGFSAGEAAGNGCARRRPGRQGGCCPPRPGLPTDRPASGQISPVLGSPQDWQARLRIDRRACLSRQLAPPLATSRSLSSREPHAATASLCRAASAPCSSGAYARYVGTPANRAEWLPSRATRPALPKRDLNSNERDLPSPSET